MIVSKIILEGRKENKVKLQEKSKRRHDVAHPKMLGEA